MIIKNTEKTMKTLKQDIDNILEELRDRPVEELVTYDLKRNWWQESTVDPWQLMCYYKKDKSPVGDCDASLRSMVIYWLAFGYKDWRLCPDGRGNFQLEKEGVGYAVRGDTMNSYATTAHAYFRLKGMEKGNGTWYDAILNHYDSFAPLWQGAFADFVKLCHTVGNMIPIPSGGLTRARGVGPMKDYFDLYLTWLFEYIAQTNEREGAYRDRLFSGISFASEVFPGMGELIEFLAPYESWDAYVRRNYLEVFCQHRRDNGETYFTKGLPLWHNHRSSNGVLPQSAEECEEFFQNAAERILTRGRQIILAIKGKLTDYAHLGLGLDELAGQMLGTEDLPA